MGVWDYLGGVSGGILGLLGGINSGKKADKRYKDYLKEQEESQDRLNEKQGERNYQYGERSAQENYKRQLDFYGRQRRDQRQDEETKYQTAVKDADKAGLSVGLIAGGGAGGGGGVSGGTPSAGNAGNIRAQQAEMASERERARTEAKLAQIEQARAISDIGVGIAEQAGIKAEIRKTNAETDNIIEDTKGKGAETELIFKKIDDLTEDIKNKKVQRTGTILQNEFDRIRNEIQNGTKDIQVKYLEASWEKLEEELREAVRNNEIGDATAETIIESTKQNLRVLIAEEIGRYANVKLTNRQIEEIGQRIDLAILDGKLNVEKLNLELSKIGINAKLQEAGHTAGFINRVATILGTIVGAKTLKK